MSHWSLARRLAAVAAPAMAVALTVTVTQSGGDARAADLIATDLGPLPICRSSDGRLNRGPLLVAMADDLSGRIGRLQLADTTSGSVDVEDNLDLFEKLGLLEGHLLIGKALLDARMQRDALPHFGHPVREIYDYLKPIFAERKSPEFEAELKDLERRAKEAPADPATTAAFNDVLAKVDGLRRTIPADLQKSADFLTLGIALMVTAAADDLGESLDKGKITNTLEYHDAMGFARYADNAVKAYGTVLGARSAAIAKETAYTLTAFPALAPPQRPSRSVADVRSAGERVKAVAEQKTPRAG